MKLPYRAGDFIALPLGDGTLARAQITACEHRVVLLTIGPFTVRTSDDALVAHRWRRIEHGKPVDGARAENAYWMPSARAEREFALRCGVAVPRQRAQRVLEIRDDAIPETIDHGVTLAWSSPLRHFGRIGELVAGARNVHVRVQDDAVQQLQAMAEWPLERLTIAGATENVPVMPNVRDLTLLTAAPIRSFPLVTRLRIIHRGEFDARDLLAMPNLEHLELIGVALDCAARFLNCPSLQALRISRTTGLAKARHVALPKLRALSLEHTGELAELSVLGEMQHVEQLELAGFWQHDLPDMDWVLQMKHLKRAAIDVGGRRKNMELYRRADWAYPWPF